MHACVASMWSLFSRCHSLAVPVPARFASPRWPCRVPLSASLSAAAAVLRQLDLAPLASFLLSFVPPFFLPFLLYHHSLVEPLPSASL